ncbi:hypothetical protein V4Y02_23965 [Escherichia coli]
MKPVPRGEFIALNAHLKNGENPNKEVYTPIQGLKNVKNKLIPKLIGHRTY